MSYNRAEICASSSSALLRPEARMFGAHARRSSMTYDNALDAIS